MTSIKLLLAFPACCAGLWFTAPARAQAQTDRVTAEIKIPTPKMPQPNAFDYYVKAGKALVAGNAGTPSAAILPKDAATDLALQRGYVAQNQKALALFRQGFAYPSRHPPIRGDDMSLMTNGTYGRFRELARLLVQEGRVKTADHDFGGAANSYLDGIRFGTDIMHGGPIMSMLVGAAVESIARGDLWKIMGRMDAAQARQAARRLEAIEASRASFSDTLEEENWVALSGLLQMIRSPEWVKIRAAKDIKEIKDINPESIGVNDKKMLASLQGISDDQIVKNYTTFMDAAIANARLPYAAKKPVLPNPADPLSRLYAGVAIRDQARFPAEKSATISALLTVAFALQAYKAERGTYPTTLAELVPQYLKKIPNDPFALGSALRYRRAGSKYVLYSFGPDGKDNGGQPVVKKVVTVKPTSGVATTTKNYNARHDSKGDIVAGINK